MIAKLFKTGLRSTKIGYRKVPTHFLMGSQIISHGALNWVSNSRPPISIDKTFEQKSFCL